jgi:4-aminobutyrate aminotransferase-like enzyme
MSSSRLLRTGVIIGGRMPKPIDGTGVRLRLDDGTEVVDAATTPATLGHRHPRMAAALVTAVEESPVLDEGWQWPTRERAAIELLERAFPGEEEWYGGVRFAVTGSEANDIALSLAQALTGRTALVTRERAYHGLVGLAREVTVQPHWHGGLSHRSGGVSPAPSGTDVRVLPFPRGSFGDGIELSAEEAREALSGSGSLVADAAAVIVDYSQGGSYTAPAYQDEVARMARAAGALWIADEVVTGLGKGGRWMNFQRGESRPDIVTLGKGLGAGAAPVAAVVVSKEIAETLEGSNWQNYSTLRSHPLSIAAARAFLEVASEESLVDRIDPLHDLLADGMRELASAHPSVERIDGRGMHWTIELYGDNWREWRADTDEVPISSRVAAEVLANGALVATSSERGSLYLSMSLIMEEHDLRQVLDALDAGLKVADGELVGA